MVVVIVFFFPSTTAIVHLIFFCITHDYHFSAQRSLSLLDQLRQPILNPIHLWISSVSVIKRAFETYLIIAIIFAILSKIRPSMCVATEYNTFGTEGRLRQRGATSLYSLPTTIDNLSTWRCRCCCCCCYGTTASRGKQQWGCRFNGVRNKWPFTFLIGWWRWKGWSLFRIRTAGIYHFDCVILFATASPTWESEYSINSLTWINQGMTERRDSQPVNSKPDRRSDKCSIDRSWDDGTG